MTTLRWPALLPLLIAAIILVGCAKRPATTQASAPAPLGAAGAGARIAGDAGPSAAASTDSAAAAAEGTRSQQSGEAAGGGDAGSAQAGASAGDAGGRAATSGTAADARGERASASRDGAEAGAVTRAGGGGAGDSARGESDGAAAGRAGTAGENAAGGAGTGSGQGQSDGAGQIASAAAGDRAGQGEAASSVTMAAARPELREFISVSELGDVHFDFDRYDIRPEDARVLDANAEWLKANPERLLLIEGHCDERGTNEYNLALGEHRAKSAMNYLISQGVQSSRMTIISYGEERPSCTDKNEPCWASNRRAHFLVKSR